MDEAAASAGMTIGQLGHRPGLHVDVNLRGKRVGGVFFDEDNWVSGVIIGLGGEGTFLTIELDKPLGSGERKGLLHRAELQDKVTIDDPSAVRPREMADVHPEGVPDEIAELVRRGKTVQAIRRYRELNGATVDEARAYIDRL